MVYEEDIADRRRTPRQFRYKLLKTATLVLLWVASGLFNSLAGVTLVDFKEKLNTDFETLGTVMVFRTVGNMVGCIASSLLRDRAGVQSELIVGMTAFVESVSTFVKPWSPSVPFFGALNFIEGCGQTCANTVNNALLLSLWGRKASAPIHSFHFGFGLGAFLAPMLVKDFLSVRCPEPVDTDATLNTTANLTDLSIKCQNSTHDHPVILERDRLVIPFSIVGSLLALLSFVLLTFYFLEKCSASFRGSYMEPPQLKGHESLARLSKPSKCAFINTFFFRFTVGLFLMYFFINTFEGVVYNYLFTFAFESGTGFTKQEAAYVSSTYWGSYTLSRLFASLIAHFVTVKIMIFVEIFGTLGSLLLMLFLGFHEQGGMWASACLLGIFVAPVWPSCIAWGDRYIRVTASVVAATDVGAGIGGSICMWIAGYMVDNKQTRSYLYFASGGCLASLITLSVMQFFGRRHGDRHESHQAKNEPSEADQSTVPLQTNTMD